ncbi:MAG: hypothetical protein ACLQLG_08540 [Thermoguttaceae bacterium]
MAHRAIVPLMMLWIATSTAGCAGTRTRPADLTDFQAAQTLTFSDLGPGSDKSVKRSVTISDARTIVEVNRDGKGDITHFGSPLFQKQ